MNEIENLIYNAKQTKKIREMWKDKTDKEITELMKIIDEDHIIIKEEKSEYKTPRIGEEYQVYIPNYKVSNGYNSDCSGYDGSVSSNSNYEDEDNEIINVRSITQAKKCKGKYFENNN